MNRALSSAECLLCAQALELGWELFLQTKRLTSQNEHVAKGALAYAILELFESTPNPRALAFRAIARMTYYEIKLDSSRLPPFKLRREMRV
jgi:hypothetical protein